MRLPRLKLLRDLLRHDGAIFVSIDDNEIHRLRCLMDEVFGEDNFMGTISWKTRNTDNRLRSNLSTDHDTNYKRDVFELCNNHATAKDWSQFVPAMRNKVVHFEVVDEDEWERRLNAILQS